VILDVPVMGVIVRAHVCVCVYVRACAKCKGENKSRDLGEIGQEVM